MLKVPNEYRVTTGPFASRAEHGNNGAFDFFLKNGENVHVIASDGEDWEHVSVSMHRRCPTWEEMCMVKNIFWGPEDVVMQLHSKQSEYVNCHPYCLHLWSPMKKQIPTPPKYMVGL